GLPNLIVQWLASAFLQGAVAGEVAFSEGFELEDFYPVDPHSVHFTREAGGLVPWQGSVRLSPETFWYVPVDPWIDDPYGRAPAAPVLQEVWFDVALIHDLRKAVHNQGWPRIDVEVLEEALLANAPANVKADSGRLAEWLSERLAEVQAAYNNLQPDDSFVHFDSVKITQAQTSGKMLDVEHVIRVVERRMTRALKQLPILMGQNEGTTETHGSVQWQIFAAGLRSLQEPVAHILSGMMQAALEASGVPGRVVCAFASIRTTDRRAEAEAERIEIENAVAKYEAGFQTLAESAIEVTGSGAP
ncbi:MAG: hypothetical protein ACYC2Y_10890, partial [Armatimonadota bacterium]